MSLQGVKYDRMRVLAARGVVVALGHDRSASEQDILGALKTVQETGHRAHVTHLFNVRPTTSSGGHRQWAGP